MKGPLGSVVASLAMHIMGFSRINSLYPQYCQYKGREFTDHAMKTYHVKCDIKPSEIDYIPQEGPFIVVSNHPFGGWDGVILYNVISSLRPDFKILTNFLLSHIKNLEDCFMPVNPFTNNKKLKSSYAGIRSAREHVANGGCLGLFPAGEVSTNYNLKSYTADKEWQRPIIKLIKNSNVPVLPVYFDGTNSHLFHYLGKIHPFLRTLRLPNEVNNKFGKTISMRIGKLISVNELSEYDHLEDLGQYLRNRCYALEANIPYKNPSPSFSADQEPIALPNNKRGLVKEIHAIENDSLLFSNANYQCFLASPERIPQLIRELGRKREESFRAVGEGTNQALDLDEFDYYYKHLILWDKQKCKIAGAYRLGIGHEIMKKYGASGFYTQTLFNYSRKFQKKLYHSIELGRSFISQDYKKEALPLVLLLRGLLYSVIKYDFCRYLIGPASISNWYPPFYRSLIVDYLSQKRPSDLRSRHVRPKHPFVTNFLRVDVDSLMSGKQDTVEKFDRYLLKLSDGEYRLPTLIKKYLKLNAYFLAFNIDKKFNDCLDGLVYLELNKVPKEEILALAKGADDIEGVLNRFGYGTGS